MNNFKKMLERANLQTLAFYIQIGMPPENLNGNDLEKREDQAAADLERRLRETVSGSDCQKAYDATMEYANDCSEIYFTVGMKAGAKLMFQLLNDSLKDN